MVVNSSNYVQSFIPHTTIIDMDISQIFNTKKKVIISDEVIQDFIQKCRTKTVFGALNLQLPKKLYIDMEEIAFKIVKIERNKTKFEITIETVDTDRGKMMNDFMYATTFLKFRLTAVADIRENEVEIKNILFPVMITECEGIENFKVIEDFKNGSMFVQRIGQNETIDRTLSEEDMEEMKKMYNTNAADVLFEDFCSKLGVK